MANGQEISKKNYQAFISWASSKTGDEFKQYIYRGKLNRKEIAIECEFAKSALSQNPRIKEALRDLEQGLRTKGILPSLEEKGLATPPKRNPEAVKVRRDTQRLNALEQQNVALIEENKQLKKKLAQYALMDEFLQETMRLPR